MKGICLYNVSLLVYKVFIHMYELHMNIWALVKNRLKKALRFKRKIACSASGALYLNECTVVLY